MTLYISHSPTDIKWYRLLKDACYEKGILVVTRANPFEYDSALTEKGKSRINASDIMVFLLTSSGRSSYRVHQELGYAQTIFKDHYIIGSTGTNVEVTRKLFQRTGLTLQNENDQHWQSPLEIILKDFAHRMKNEAFNFVFHTDERRGSSISF